jgi:hypothetical protein
MTQDCAEKLLTFVLTVWDELHTPFWSDFLAGAVTLIGLAIVAEIVLAIL